MLGDYVDNKKGRKLLGNCVNTTLLHLPPPTPASFVCLHKPNKTGFWIYTHLKLISFVPSFYGSHPPNMGRMFSLNDEYKRLNPVREGTYTRPAEWIPVFLAGL